jgi:hypothetical protein|nr:MAG TPA: hypothetical protein [Caudoviricetes sp.]
MSYINKEFKQNVLKKTGSFYGTFENLGNKEIKE